MMQAARHSHTSSTLFKCIIVTTFVLLSATPSLAGSRIEARNAIDQLQYSDTARKKSDDLASIEATFSMAEQFMLQNSREMAERYYLLTIQKARILALFPIAPVIPPGPTDYGPSTGAPLLPAASPAPDDASPPKPAEPEDEPLKPIIIQTEMTNQPGTVSEVGPANEPVAAAVSSDKIVGQASTYTIVKNDTLRLISAKLGVSKRHLAQTNRLDQKALLKVGKKLHYNNRKIVPYRMQNGIVINIPDRTLYHFTNGKLVTAMPVALGVPKKNEKYDWTTPTGKFKIIDKQKDPTWHVPPSIQSEMEEDGKDVITSVPPGPANPLGKYAMKTSLPGILIHSTTKPWSIYSFASHGCIRVYPDHMEEFFKKIRVNTPGEIIYRPVKLAITENGRVYLEVHQDAYGKSASLQTMAKQLIKRHKLSNRVDWDKVESVIRHKAGLAEDITL